MAVNSLLLLLFFYVLELATAVTNSHSSSGTTNHDSLFPSNNLTKSPHTYTRACNNHCYSVYEERLFCGEQDSDVLMEDSYRCLCLNETFWSHYNRCNCIDEIENYEFDIYVFKNFHC